jgi:crotonobetainyl-CoA:carnitine CoA-transferase CaiB-like acyl-CoA transferase
MNAQRFLENVRVIDLSQYIPGPFATRQLADLGAEVIKIEPPHGDPMRFFMHNDTHELSPIYRHINRGKRVCKLDLKSAAGKQALSELMVDADILLESYRPGVLARLGFDRNELDRINPGLIHCALSGYGQNGPYALRAGHDINYNALSSQSIVSGTAQRPIIAYPPIADHAAAMQASIAMLAALHARGNNPGSVYLDISIAESIMAWQYLPILTNGEERAESLLNGGAACYNIYQCADERFISLGAIESGFWENFCSALQKPEWITRQYEPMPQRELIAEVAEHITQRPLNHWHQLLDVVDCCYAPLLTPGGLSENPQIQARHSLSESGPNYPGWINDAAVEIEVSITEIEHLQSLNWRPRK